MDRKLNLWTSRFGLIFQSAPKERRRRHAEKRLSKRVFLESPFPLCPLKGLLLKHMKTLSGQRGNGLSKNTLLDYRFSAQRLRRSFGAPPILREKCSEKSSRQIPGKILPNNYATKIPDTSCGPATRGERGKRERCGQGGGWGEDRQRNRQVNAHTFVETAL